MYNTDQHLRPVVFQTLILCRIKPSLDVPSNGCQSSVHQLVFESEGCPTGNLVSDRIRPLLGMFLLHRLLQIFFSSQLFNEPCQQFSWRACLQKILHFDRQYILKIKLEVNIKMRWQLQPRFGPASARPGIFDNIFSDLHQLACVKNIYICSDMSPRF